MSNIVICIREFTNALPALARMFNEARPTDPRVTYRIAQLRRALAAHDAPDAPHNVVRAQLVAEHAVHDDQGQPVGDERGALVFKSPAAQAAFEASMAAIMEERIEIAGAQITLEMIDAMRLPMPLSVNEMDSISWLIAAPEPAAVG